MEQDNSLNVHNKQEYPPMHTVEHILNQTMIRKFGCSRSQNAHIERTKSKCDYTLPQPPTNEQMIEVEQCVNGIIAQHLPVYAEYMTREKASEFVDLTKLPDEAGDKLRIVRVGDYDTCACIGAHVDNTSEIGTFKIISFDYNAPTLRIRFKILS